MLNVGATSVTFIIESAPTASAFDNLQEVTLAEETLAQNECLVAKDYIAADVLRILA